MNIDALVKLYYLSLVISTAVVAVLAVILRRHAIRFKETSRLLVIGPIIAVVVAGGFFVLVSSIGFYSAPDSCVTCHEMEPEYKTWRRSKHSRVTCLACHTKEDGVVPFLIAKAGGLGEVARHITGAYPKIINKDSHVAKEEMDSLSCQRCHDPKKLGIVKFGDDVRVSHQPHIQLGITCQYCHNRVAHEGARGYNYLNGLRMMDGCFRCHMPGGGRSVKGVKAPTKCSTCHAKGIAKQTFGKATPTKADMHECRKCHRLSNPSVVKEFKRSKMAKVLDCPDCHQDHLDHLVADPDPAACNQCHAKIAAKVVKQTHGPDIKTPFKRASEVRCSFCHKPHSFEVAK